MSILKEFLTECKIGSHYEASMTLVHGISKAINNNQFDKGCVYCVKGISVLTESKKFTVAADVGSYFCKLLKKQDEYDYVYKAFDSKGIDLVIGICQMFGDDIDSKLLFLKKCLDLWRKRYPTGHPSINYEFSKICVLKKAWKQGHDKFSTLNGHEEEHAQAILDWSKEGFKKEKDLFFCRSVLEKMCIGIDVQSTKKFFKILLEKMDYQDRKTRPPLVNCCEFMIISVELKNYYLLEFLFKTYHKNLKRESDLFSSISEICSNTFPNKKNFIGNRGNMNFMSMFRGVLGKLGMK